MCNTYSNFIVDRHYWCCTVQKEKCRFRFRKFSPHFRFLSWLSDGCEWQLFLRIKVFNCNSTWYMVDMVCLPAFKIWAYVIVMWLMQVLAVLTRPMRKTKLMHPIEVYRGLCRKEFFKKKWLLFQLYDFCILWEESIYFCNELGI